MPPHPTNTRGIRHDELLSVSGLTKSLGGRQILSGIDLVVPRGSLCTVMGPSGAGKSVLLKCLANLMNPDAGEISFEGVTLDFQNPAQRRDFLRRCSFLFQSNALFDSLTALQNVSLPLEQTTRMKDSAIRERALEALRQLELQDHAEHFPCEMSGGMQKRLALARAIVTKPDLVFFDEPTAGLDPLRRNSVFTMIAKYQMQFGFTALVVTHDIVEALVASDRVALLHNGGICFSGTPAEFGTSAHPVVRSFRDSPDELRKTLESIRSQPETIPSSKQES